MHAYIDGDSEAFERVYRVVRPVVRRILGARLRRTGSVIADMEQEVFARAHRARFRFESPVTGDDENVVKWYASIARNTANSELRRVHRASKRVASIRRDVYLQTDWRLAQDVDVADPLEQREWDRRVQGLIYEALYRINKQQRETIIQHKMKGIPYEELSKQLDASPGALRVRTHRGCRALRRELEALAPAWFELSPTAGDPCREIER